MGDFGKALEQVIRDYAPDRILIEPSGVGKLSDVEGCRGEGRLRHPSPWATWSPVADAGKCKMYMKNFGEFYNNQWRPPGTIVLSRTQTVAPEKLAAAGGAAAGEEPPTPSSSPPPGIS